MSFEEEAGDLMPLTLSSEDYYEDQMETKSNSSTGHECHPNGTLVYPAQFGENITHVHASEVSKISGFREALSVITLRPRMYLDFWRLGVGLMGLI